LVKGVPGEVVAAEGAVELHNAGGAIQISLQSPLRAEGEFTRSTVELDHWDGGKSLHLLEPLVVLE
jgi:hypothetical protein